MLNQNEIICSISNKYCNHPYADSDYVLSEYLQGFSLRAMHKQITTSCGKNRLSRCKLIEQTIYEHIMQHQDTATINHNLVFAYE